MTLTGVGAAAVVAAAALPGAVTALTGAPLSLVTDDELLNVVRLAERARRQLEAFDAVLITELEARNVAGSVGGPRVQAVVVGVAEPVPG
jgi:hypothetical protein